VSGERVSLRDLLRGLAWSALRRGIESGDLAQGVRDFFDWQLLAMRTDESVMLDADAQQTTWPEQETRA
jgi:hypothetical protein